MTRTQMNRVSKMKKIMSDGKRLLFKIQFTTTTFVGVAIAATVAAEDIIVFMIDVTSVTLH